MTTYFFMIYDSSAEGTKESRTSVSEQGFLLLAKFLVSQVDNIFPISKSFLWKMLFLVSLKYYRSIPQTKCIWDLCIQATERAELNTTREVDTKGRLRH